MSTPQVPADDIHVFSVSELNRTVRDLLEMGLGAIWIEGELSNIARPASGHFYFSLKDRDAQVRCAMFRNRNRLLDFTPEAGEQVRARARVSVYEARGDYQLIVEHLEPAGTGDLARAFEALKRRLAAEGLFDAAHKRALPDFPRCIGVITSASGAALRDVLHVHRRRFPAIPVVVYPTAVQGAAAVPGIVDMLARAGRRSECDVLLLVRGGGSLEDLQAFNEEAVARAIVACPIPVVSGIGHEIDVTIADLAADQRAPTPSAAAELVTPDGEALARQTSRLRERLLRSIERRLTTARERLRGVTRRLDRQHPSRRLEQRGQRCDELTERLGRAGHLAIERRRNRLTRAEERLHALSPQRRLARLGDRHARACERLTAAMAQRLRTAESRLQAAVRALHAVSPLATLGRGYALVRRPDGRPVTTATAVKIDEPLDVLLARGRLDVRVEARHDDSDEEGETS